MKKCISCILACSALILALAGCDLTTLKSQDYSDGSYTCGFSVINKSNNKPVNPSIENGSFLLERLDGPLYDGVVKYAGNATSFFVTPLSADEDFSVSVTSSKNSVVSVRECMLIEDANRVILEFKNEGKATVTFTSNETGEEVQYGITVKKHYDCNPGKRKLSPSEFVDCFSGIAEANGMERMNMTTETWGDVVWAEENENLTWTAAVKLAEGCVSDWWFDGYRYFNFYYVGEESSGGYRFAVYLGA